MPFKSSEKEPERFAQKNRDKKTKDGKEQVSQYFSRHRKCGPHKGKYCIDGKSSLMSTNVSDHDLSRLSDNEMSPINHRARSTACNLTTKRPSLFTVGRLVPRQTAPDNFCRVPKPSDIFLCIFGNIRCLHMNRNHRHDLPQAEILFQQN